jgi:hypothetical protein
MKRLKPQDLPEVLTPEIIDILVQMAMEFPKVTSEWADISELLEKKGQLNVILDKVDELKKEENKRKQASLSDEEKRTEAEKWTKIHEEGTPGFHGNMGEPETPEEYERKYGKKKK